LPSDFATEILYVFLFSSIHATSFWLYFTKSTSHEAPHYAAFANLLSLNLFQSK
jgi:hypothetical protein